jgi:asparagine synthase (glutamine-hydrolysing)
MAYFFWLSEPLSLSLLNPELTHDLPCVGEALAESLNSIPQETPDLNRMLFLDTKFFLADHNLNYTDKMSMAAGIETRVPFLDNDLVRLAARLPVRAKLYRNEGKRILKKLMTRHLPRDVVYRPKTGFGVPLRSWLRGDLRPFVEEILSEGALRQRGLFSPEAVNRLLLLDRQGRVDAAGSLLAVICAELWFQVFEDNSHPASLPLS